jgi:hypothetical protein
MKFYGLFLLHDYSLGLAKAVYKKKKKKNFRPHCVEMSGLASSIVV